MGKKRSHGEGNITQRPGGTWQAQVMVGRRDDGKKVTKSFSGATKSEVLRKLREYQQSKDARLRTEANYRFAAWAEDWYKGYEDQVAASTYSNYRYTLAILTREFGTVPIADLLPMNVTTFLSRLRKEGASDSQITKCRAMLIQILDSAVENSLILRNPARVKRRLRKREDVTLDEPEPDSEKDAFTPEEVELLFRDLPKDLLGNSIRLLLKSGMRVQELLALTADDIAEDGATIRINKAVKIVDGKAVLGPPKSRAGYRTIPLPQAYRHLAVRLREHGSRPFLWKSRKPGKPYTVGAFRSRYYHAIEKISGVRRLSPHCCRHTYVTELQRRGVGMEVIARLVGHSDITMTDHYLHISVDTLAGAVGALDDAKPQCPEPAQTNTTTIKETIL